MAEGKHIQRATGGMSTVIAPKLMPNDKYIYSLNCDITSTADGNLGVITNVKGNVAVNIDLPSGENKTIGSVRNDESNKMYFAVWNSERFHTWYEFDYISLSTKIVVQCITDTGGVDIWSWEREVLVNSANIVNDVLLYWTMEGHPARKINITKAIEKSEDGYGNVILDEYTRAYKRSPEFAPVAEYFTNPNLRKNNVYRRLFQWCARFIYDDNEHSTFSDFSRVAVPDEENVTGTLGVPLENNGINVRFPTGGMLVKKIELAMRSTTDVAGVISPWVSIAVFDKDILEIGDNTEYTYEFYNDNTYISLPQADINQQQSDLPDNPKVQEFTYNTLVYGNFYDGFPAVKVDLDFEVEYTELFVPDGQENVLNDPFFTVNTIAEEWESGGFLSGGGWRKTEGELIVGPDVKSGNIFKLFFTNDFFSKKVRANLNDDAKSIASKFRTDIAAHPRTQSKGGYVGSVTEDGSGFARFRFKIWNHWNEPYIGFDYNVTPVNYSSLKDTGNSVPNEKLGSSFRYAVRYENEDGKRSLAYGAEEVVSIDTINDLGEIKKVATVITIKYKAPAWAKRYSIVRTKNLSKSDYIQLLIQRITVASTSNGEEYHDLIIGSLFTYQKVHPNTTLNYEFKAGDRVRLLKEFSGDQWNVPQEVVDYEVLAYYPEIRNIVNQNVTIDGSSAIQVDAPDPSNIGNNVIIAGSERTIVGVTGNGYSLDASIGGSTEEATYPSYEIINRDGILRIKMDSAFPINVDPSNDEFALVEIYSPTQTFSNIEEENYYDIGYKFEIVEEDGQRLHRGNSQDQTASLPAIVRVEGFDNYVRNRDLITNNSATNPQSKITSIEDASYSDFYNSDLSSLGRPTRLDDSRGVVHFEDRLIWSNNFIEDTKINGLNMFLSTNRVDYNDKYGSIQAAIFYEGKLYVFKFLKTGWVPVFGNLIVDSEGNQLVGTSTRLLPDKMEYFLWEGGVGNNPESIVKIGNEVFGVSPNSQVIFTIGGAGVIPTSKIYGIDNYAREIISEASLSGANMYGGINRRKNQYLLMIDNYEKPAYVDNFTAGTTEVVPVAKVGDWELLSNPSNGTVTRVMDTALYSPNFNFSGMDYFSYWSIEGVTRQVCVNVLSVDNEVSWLPAGEYCVVEESARTGYVGYTLLRQYDNISETFTGLEKPNVSEDPDYVAPVENLNLCPIGLEFTRVAILSADKGTQRLEFFVESVDNFNIQVRAGQSISGTLVEETGLVSSGAHTINSPISSGEYSVYLIVNDVNYAGVTTFIMDRAYVKSARFNDMTGLEVLELDQSNIPSSHDLVFSSIDLTRNTALKTLKIVNHKLTSIDLGDHPMIEELDVSNGSELISLTIGSWPVLRILRIHNCKFTASGYTTSYVNSVITTFNSNAPSSAPGYVLQYGQSVSTGIRPSASVANAYNSLVSKGVDVIGIPPVVTEATLTVSVGVPTPTNNRTTASISPVIPTPFNVTYELTVREDGIGPIVYRDHISLDFNADQGVAQRYIPGNWQPNHVFAIRDVVVTPASPGGVTVTIENQNPG